MFKLESYITPWLLSYIDQYVKLRREDFQLSLWGGDVVFYNLELRLANIQKLVPTLPIIFQSGVIHELRIHIPWIRINSEPIVVTINQIELVIVLNKECTLATDDAVPSDDDLESDHILIQQQQPATPEQSNYVQTVLARILNNVHIVVNNLIVKFVEENIVISLSSRTAECYGVNQNWLKSFVELTQQDLSLRRLITLPDITLCLDKRDLNGKVHRYEVPLLSRCSFECRIQMFYSHVYQQLNTKPIQTRLSFNCANIEVSMVDNQLSMIRRLIESIMLIVNKQIQSNEATPQREQKKISHSKSASSSSFTGPSALPSPPPPPPPTPPPIGQVSAPSFPALSSPESQTNTTSNNSQPGWISWAWSYVPSVTTLFAEDDLPPDVNNSNLNGIMLSPEIKELNSEQYPLPPIVTETTTTTDNTTVLPNATNVNHTPTPLLFAGIELDRISLQYKITKTTGTRTTLVPFIGFLVEKANITVEHFKPTSTTAVDGQAVVSRVRKVKVSTSKMSLTWDERLCLSLSNVHFTLHYDRHVRMTHFSLTINDLNANCNDALLIYPCRAILKLDHHKTYSLLHLEFSSLTGKIDFNTLAYLIKVINQIRMIVDVATALFQPSKIVEQIADDVISVDDLRNGSMKCVFESTHELPAVNEIYFAGNDPSFASYMTWKYPQRRSILKCHILPLPFDNELISSPANNRIKTVECLMQYWHFGTKQFVTWQTFELSDGQPLFLDFSNDLGQNPYSEMWRIVLLNASSIINQANSLAASTRIDSLQSQRYEPSIEMTIKVPHLRFHFMIDPQREFLSSNFQSILNGCKHDVLTLHLDNLSFDLSQRFETKLISIETILSLEALEYRFLTKRSCIEPTVVNLDLFIDISKSNVLSTLPEIFEANNGKYNQLFRSAKTAILYQLYFDIDHINIRLSQSLCHLINIICQQWIRSDMIDVLDLNKQGLALKKNTNRLYYTYYLFTNHLNCPVGIKQYNTRSKSLVLSPLESTDFVWSRLKTEDIFIEFSLENSSEDPISSSPINIHHTDNNTHHLVQFLNSPHSFYLQIHYDEHRIRRHVHVLGRLVLKNLCNVDLNIKLYLKVGSRQIDFFVSKDQSYVSCLQSREDIEYIQWNLSPKYSFDQLNQDGVLSTSEHTSVWIHLFECDNLTSFIFTPIVVYRSYLTQSVLLHLNQDKPWVLQSNGAYTFLNDFDFENSSPIYEHRLQQIDAEQLSPCIFELNKQSYTSLSLIDNMHKDSTPVIDYLLRTKVPSTIKTNEYNQSYSIIDFLRQQHSKLAETEDDIPVPLIEQADDVLEPSFVPSIGANGPVGFEPSIPKPTKRRLSAVNPMILTSNSIDCRVEPIRLYSHLNTILIQLKPLTLVNNLTPFSFHLYANASRDHVYIYPEQINCLSKLEYSQMQFVLMDPYDGEHIQCQTIDLIFRNISMMGSAHIINNRLYANGSIDLYFIKSSNNDYFIFHLKHEYLDHTHILTIESKYRFSNQTLQTLLCYVLPISRQQFSIDYSFNCLDIKPNEKMNLYRFQGVPSTDIVYYLLFQHENNERQCLSKPIQLMTHTDEAGNRQCFCLFKKDEQIKLRSSPYQSLRGELYSVTQSIKTLTSPIDITIDLNPSWAFLQVVNTCTCPLLCRLENISSMSHIIPPLSSSFIGIDSSEISAINMNTASAATNNTNTNNNAQNLMNGSRFYLAQFPLNDTSMNLIQLMTHYFQQVTTKNVQWSRPLRIDAQLEDIFLPVPGLHDVLIRSSPAPLFSSRTLIVEPVHRQRLNKTIVTSKSDQLISMNSSVTITNSSVPQATIISETAPRHYRSNTFDKNAPLNPPTITNQYIKLWQQQYNQRNHRQLQLNFAINKISVSLMDELSDICLFNEILRITVDKLNLMFYQHSIDVEPCLLQDQFFCSIDQFQIDNQCYSPKTSFDFPVVLMSKDEKRVSKTKTNVYEHKERANSASSISNHHRQNSSSSIDTTITEDHYIAFDSLSHNHKVNRPNFTTNSQPKFLIVHFHRINERFLKIDFQLQSFDVYLEDQYVYVLLRICSDLLPLNLNIPINIDNNEIRIDGMENLSSRIPFVCESLNIGPIDIVISVHASIKVYIGCHQLPMFVDRFQKNYIYATNKQLLTLVTRHYLLSLLTRSPILLGSFDLLGNPSALIRNITDGVYDLFHLPYVGMSEGPTGFMRGISQGATSLLRHLSLGTLTSLTTFANSLAKNMDRLAMDQEHSTRTEETCRQIPVGMTDGLLQGLELFGLSLLGAIAGLAEQPLASFRNRSESQPATTTVLSGVGKGLVGIIVKPVSGVAQLISQTGQGILYGTGLMNIPHRRHRQLEQDARINTNISYLKLTHSCQITNRDEILDTLDYVLEHENIEHGTLILTKNKQFVVYHNDDENQHDEYSLDTIELSESPESSGLLVFNNLSFYVDSRLRHQFLALCRLIRH